MICEQVPLAALGVINPLYVVVLIKVHSWVIKMM